jgi:hypothetical protein
MSWSISSPPIRMLFETTIPPRRLGDRQAGPDRGGHRLLDEAGPTGPGVQRRIEDRALLDFGHARRDADDHAWPRQESDPVVDLVHEVANHLLGHVEVADHAVAERSDGHDVRRRPADHPLRLGPDGQDALRPGLDRDDGRLADHDPAVADVDERVRRAEVDADVAGEQAEEAVEHARSGTSVGGRPAGRGRTEKYTGGAREVRTARERRIRPPAGVALVSRMRSRGPEATPRHRGR